MRRLTHTLAMLVVAAAASSAVHAVDPTQSVTVIGPLNPQLVNGATALDSGRIEEGIRLTLEGVKLPADPGDVAAGYANLCAGYALLKQWDEALHHCNTALDMDKSNWRAFNNRAAVFAGKQQYELAVSDLHEGLKIAPNARMLHESLRIIQENKRSHGRQRRLVSLPT